ncbi:MAG: DNA polymerase III subunit delta, partial [Myxococcota bacterium]
MATVSDRIARGDLDPVYILISDQPLLLERTHTSILDAALPEAARGFNLDLIDGKGMSANQVLGAAQTLPMMAARRVVSVREISAATAGELAKLIPYLGDPSETTVLIATASKVDKRIKFFAQAKKKKYLHELSAPREVDSWLRREARTRGVDIDPRALGRLAEVIGRDLSRLALALDQLTLYAGDRTITPGDVDDLIAATRERTVFELTDAIGDGNLPAALAASASLCDQRQSVIGVVIMLARYMRQLAMCRDAQLR